MVSFIILSIEGLIMLSIGSILIFRSCEFNLELRSMLNAFLIFL